MEPIEKTIKKITAATSKANMETSDNTKKKTTATAKTQEACPICGGIGYVRRDLPVDDPNFGILEVCVCQKENYQRVKVEGLYNKSNLNALRDMTFNKFNICGHNDSNQINIDLEGAFNTARAFSHNLNGWLVLTGGPGCGKTHLAVAIAHEAVSLGIETIFKTVPDLLDWLRYSFGSDETSYESIFEEIRNVQLLILDDFGTQNTTQWAKEKLFQIINHRYVNKLATVITTNSEIQEFDERTQSRLLDSSFVTRKTIKAPDFRNASLESGHSDNYFSSLYLINDRSTFENFSDRRNEKFPIDEQRSLDKAVFAAQEFAENPNGWLVFVGKTFTGKTHLAAAIGRYRAKLGFEPIFISVPDLLDHLRSTFSPGSLISYDKVFVQVKNANLLILDNLMTQNASPWAKEKLWQILNHRYELRLPTVITTSSNLDEIDQQILSRILDERVCSIYKLILPSYRPKNSRKNK
jgi:DNA replication protein DnaC